MEFRSLFFGHLKVDGGWVGSIDEWKLYLAMGDRLGVNFSVVNDIDISYFAQQLSPGHQHHFEGHQFVICHNEASLK